MAKFNHPSPILAYGRKPIRRPKPDFKSFRDHNLPLIESALNIRHYFGRLSDDGKLPADIRKTLVDSLHEARRCGTRLMEGWENLDDRTLVDFISELIPIVFNYAEVVFGYRAPVYLNPKKEVKESNK